MLIDRNISIKPFNTFSIDVISDYLIHVGKTDDLSAIFSNSKYKSIKKMILGGGSNVLFTRNFLGIIIRMEIPGIKIEQESKSSVLVSAGAGENWHQLVLWAVDNGLGGIENLSLIPGTVGAAPMQNIGAYGAEIKDVFHSLEAYEISTGKIVRFYKEDCRFGYRRSIFKEDFKDKYIITKVFLSLAKKPVFNVSYGQLKATLEEMGVEELSLKKISQAVINIRQKKLPDPLEIGNAGSFFKNPEIDIEHYQALQAAFEGIPGYHVDDHIVKVPAAWLIEQMGWKGKKYGEIGIHKNQPLVLVNYGGGKGSEIEKLSKKVQKSVFDHFGIELDTEVNII